MRENILVFKIVDKYSMFADGDEKNINKLGICKVGIGFREFNTNSRNIIQNEGIIDISDDVLKILKKDNFILDDKIAKECLDKIKTTKSPIEALEMKNEELLKQMADMEEQLKIVTIKEGLQKVKRN